MNVLVIGADSNYAIERPYVRYLKSEIDSVDFFAAQNPFLEYYNKSISNKVFYRLGLSSILKTINKDLLQRVDQVQPQVVFVFKGMEIFPETLKRLAQRGIKLVNYNPDNPFFFSGKGSGNTNITRSISLYDFHFTYNLSIKKRLEEQYHAKTEWLPFGFDLTDEEYNECAREEEVVGACFIGNPDKSRADFLRQLADRGVELTLYGYNWSRHIRHTNVTVYNTVSGLELWKAMRRYRVQINLMRPHNVDSHNMRTFEVPGVGGIMLAPDTIEHRIFFEDEKEVFLFTSVDSCVSKIRSLLRLTSSQANQIRQNARVKSISSGYTYRDRAHQVVKVLQSL